MIARRTLLAAILLGSPLVNSADSLECEGGIVTITPATGRTGSLVCEAAARAISELARCGIAPSEPFRVHVVRELPPECPEHALAYFDARTRVVTIPTYADCVRLAGPDGRLGMAMTRSLYRSLIVHELAHAVVSGIGGRAAMGRAAHEYLAYATQFAAMEPALRTRILEDNPVTLPVRRAELSEVYFDLSPERFAVKAYLHFRDSKNRCRFAHQLLDGTIELPSGIR